MIRSLLNTREFIKDFKNMNCRRFFWFHHTTEKQTNPRVARKTEVTGECGLVYPDGASERKAAVGNGDEPHTLRWSCQFEGHYSG